MHKEEKKNTETNWGSSQGGSCLRVFSSAECVTAKKLFFTMNNSFQYKLHLIQVCEKITAMTPKYHFVSLKRKITQNHPRLKIKEKLLRKS